MYRGDMLKQAEIDWSECLLVERDPDKVGGQPLVKGTRIPVEVIVIDEEHNRTPEQTKASFPTLELETIRQIRAFARAHRRQLQL